MFLYSCSEDDPLDWADYGCLVMFEIILTAYLKCALYSRLFARIRRSFSKQKDQKNCMH